jgi:hypothetical protein
VRPAAGTTAFGAARRIPYGGAAPTAPVGPHHWRCRPGGQVGRRGMSSGNFCWFVCDFVFDLDGESNVCCK